MPKITNRLQRKPNQFRNLAEFLLEFELGYFLGKKLTKTSIIKLRQEFKRIVKDVGNIPINPSSKNMSNQGSKKP